jgi:putative spermidine/putrescine transport system permease protein
MQDSSTTTHEPLVTADGVPLKQKLIQSTRRARWRALLLTLPLVIFVLVSFIFPIGQMLLRSVNNDTASSVLPNFTIAIKDWDEQGLPPEETIKLFVLDMQVAREKREIGKTVGNLATRINYEIPGSRSLFTSSSRKLTNVTEGPYTEALLEISEKWDNPVLWRSLKRATSDFTPYFYMAALDLKYDDEGNITEADELYQIYVSNFFKTLRLSATITFICLLLAFPVSYLLSTLPLKTSNLLMILVLLPFWTSLLVRTTAWIAILQTEGIINDILVFIGLVGDDGRVQMIYNQTGTIIAMVHILLPFMILPLFSVMKTIPPSYMRAASSMGAKTFTAFRRIYFPLTLPGIAAGTLLVFILAIGYYITPALVGGEDGLLISNLIAYHIQKSLNWSLGAALGSLLLVIVLVLYWLYNKIVGIEKLSFG